MQRINFEDSAEEEQLLPAVQQLEPLPEMATTTGFREELTIRIKKNSLRENRFEVIIPLGYEPPLLEEINKTLGLYHISLSQNGPLLSAHLPLESLTTEALTHAQEHILAVRLFFQAAATSDNPRTLQAAIIGFENMMRAK